jgi:hypothetical protein
MFSKVVSEDGFMFQDAETKARAMKNTASMNNFIEKY